ncbi:hypothetical protein PV05_05747 [Exophiala xenobiotica]|uniref:Dextranase n=1 Tax=Exophiala xenobiotica TaxID=348802 RepID=A0A0D2BXJ8_9EURO|nr:uncharacterized protein PV05_05747 [Exophiala xenobiotica]KIW57156.1 hypothetical protein PV05_05747 [Exophiala xenobiotica]
MVPFAVVSGILRWLILASTCVGLALGSLDKTLRYANYTCCDSQLCTWWHSTGEVNTLARVANANVRQSRKYLVQVSNAGRNQYHNSFVYESIPRNGNGRIYSPWDPPYTETMPDHEDDGISIELDGGINMAWSQFEYASDVDVKILSRDGSSLGPTSEVKVRPRSLSFDMTTSNDGGIIIRVPANTKGYRFSVEFDADLFTYRSDGRQYVSSGGEVVGVEPTNALMIFASAFLRKDLIPSVQDSDTIVMQPGPINQGDWGSSGVLYFPPGVYWMDSNLLGVQGRIGENHIRLHPNTYWVYLAPGAYVKGAIEFSTKEDFYATGHGVLSGEHYVYQANWAADYRGLKSDGTSLRLWLHQNLSHDHQTWTCVGPTINAPPFNTMDFIGSDNISVEISDYKQVAAFYYQTDGPQVYPNSHVHDVFYHVNDDAIKTYYSDALIERVIIWKCHNDPIIQMGWDSRRVTGVQISDLSIIHTRYKKSETGVPSAVIGASPFYKSGREPDLTKYISMNITNIVCEGICPGLMRITPLQNFVDFNIQNIIFPDGLPTGHIGLGQSIVPGGSGVRFDVQISDWTVGGQMVTMDNYGVDSLGQLHIDESYDGQWKIRDTGRPLMECQVSEKYVRIHDVLRL